MVNFNFNTCLFHEYDQIINLYITAHPDDSIVVATENKDGD
jgi:hypothetical protein